MNKTFFKSDSSTLKHLSFLKENSLWLAFLQK